MRNLLKFGFCSLLLVSGLSFGDTTYGSVQVNNNTPYLLFIAIPCVGLPAEISYQYNPMSKNLLSMSDIYKKCPIPAGNSQMLDFSLYVEETRPYVETDALGNGVMLPAGIPGFSTAQFTKFTEAHVSSDGLKIDVNRIVQEK